mgnify:CR=1 FL=1
MPGVDERGCREYGNSKKLKYVNNKNRSRKFPFVKEFFNGFGGRPFFSYWKK